MSPAVDATSSPRCPEGGTGLGANRFPSFDVIMAPCGKPLSSAWREPVHRHAAGDVGTGDGGSVAHRSRHCCLAAAHRHSRVGETGARKSAAILAHGARRNQGTDATGVAPGRARGRPSRHAALRRHSSLSGAASRACHHLSARMGRGDRVENCRRSLSAALPHRRRRQSAGAQTCHPKSVFWSGCSMS